MSSRTDAKERLAKACRRTGLALASAALLAGVAPASQPADAAYRVASGSPAPAQEDAALRVTSANYTIPKVTLIRDDGRAVSLDSEIDDGRPVVLNFIFTTCGSICPLMSQVFGQFQHQLGPGAPAVHLMSISVDPEEDTPARLRAYAAQFDARPGWAHYTGTLDASVSAQRAFDVYRGDKMSHRPVTLMRVAPGHPWVRLDGFVSPAELMHRYSDMLAVR